MFEGSASSAGLIRGGGQPINRDMGSVSAPFTLLSQYLALQMATRNEIPWLMSEEQTQVFFSSSASTNCAKHSWKSGERPRMDTVPVQALLHIIPAALMFQPARVTAGTDFNATPNTQPQHKVTG